MKKILLNGRGEEGGAVITGYALVDDEDYTRLNMYHWYLSRGYACRYVYLGGGQGPEGKHQPMHRDVNQTPEGLITDHINGNTLDNRRENLRSCTQTQNSRNRGPDENKGSSKYKGVYRFKKSRSYVARIHVGGKNKTIGSYPTAEEAAQAYNQLSTHFYGEFAWHNDVPDTTINYVEKYYENQKRLNKTDEERRLAKNKYNRERYSAKREEILKKQRDKRKKKRKK